MLFNFLFTVRFAKRKTQQYVFTKKKVVNWLIISSCPYVEMHEIRKKIMSNSYDLNVMHLNGCSINEPNKQI